MSNSAGALSPTTRMRPAVLHAGRRSPCGPARIKAAGAGPGGRQRWTATARARGAEEEGANVPSVLRRLFGLAELQVPTAQATATATAAAAAAAAAAPAAAAAVPSGPYGASQAVYAASAAATSAAAAEGAARRSVQPLAALADQVLTGSGAAADDPVAAAQQLQLFLLQYRDQYGPETDARITAAVTKLQDYIDGHGFGGAGGAAGGLADALGGDAGMMGLFAASQAGTTAAASDVADAVTGGAGGGGEKVYHNYILEQLTGVLDWVNGLLVNNAKPYTFDAYGRAVGDIADTAERQQEQLRAASNSLRVLIQQLQQVNAQYASVADSEERTAMGQVLSQLTTMADRLAAAASRRPLPPLSGGGAATDAAAAAAADVAPYVPAEQLYSVDKYRDPLLRVLDGIYNAVVVDSGLREFLGGIKQLGDSLAASMAVEWSGAPPIGRLIAYIAAVAGVLFVMRTRLPQSLLSPPPLPRVDTDGADSNGGRQLASSSSSSGASPLARSGNGNGSSATPANPAAAGAFASILGDPYGSSNGNGNGNVFGGYGGGSNGRTASSLASLDRDGGIGDTRLPSEVIASGDPYAARKVLIEATAMPVRPAAVGALAGGNGKSAAAAVAERPPPVVASASGNGNGRAGANGGLGNGWVTLTGSAAQPGSLPKPPPGGWTSQHSDRTDWWAMGAPATPQQQQPPPQQQQQQVPAATPAAPRTVAESWEAFRRSSSAADAAAAAATAGSSSSSSSSGVGMLDTTAALAAAAVAAAVGPSASGPARSLAAAAAASSDPKVAELARAAEERRMDRDRARLRTTIKDRLRWVCLALGPVSSVVPGGEPLRDEVDGLLGQLEALSPTDKPLNTVVDVTRRPTVVDAPAPRVDPLLLGEWRLVYASNAGAAAGQLSAASQAASGGPNLLAQVLQIADSLPGFGMTHVVQRLTLDDSAAASSAASASAPRYASTSASYGSSGSGSSSDANRSPGAAASTILTENSAVFRFGPLGSWRVTVRGRWYDNGGGMCAAAEFESFSVRPVDLWGLPLEQMLPEVVVPVPEVLRSRSEWCTTYLDEEMRVGRGSGGALFLFRRGAPEAEGAPAAAAAGGAGVGAVPVAAPSAAAAAAAVAHAAMGGPRRPFTMRQL